MPFEYSIDENKSLILQFDPADSRGHIKAHLHSLYADDSRLVKNILPLMTLNGIAPAKDGNAFDIPDTGAPVELIINKQPFAHFTVKDGKTELLGSPRKLTVFESRVVGRALQHDAPYPVIQKHLDEALKLTPLTDLHTHFSAQISASDLIQMGLNKKHEVLYPTAALQMLGIAYPKEGLTRIPMRIFQPLAHLQLSGNKEEEAIPLSQLSKESLRKLEKALDLSPEKQSTFRDFETCYYLREPFTKDIRLFPDILRKAAENFRKDGIRYAEASTGVVLKPEWLKVIHELLPGIEKETGVQLRFRAGLPRTLNEDALNEQIEQYKRVAASPYIIGPDILGYEMNKTSHLEAHLKELMGWMHRHQPDASIQIHAGENSKNPDNVKEALKFGLEHNIRVMVGHSLYGIDDETMSLAAQAARQGKVIIQFLIDSNLAGNNIDHPKDVTISQFLEAGIPSVLATDGAALYSTSARQTAVAGLFAGVSPQGFQQIRRTEEAYINEQQKIFDAKKAAFPEKGFFDSPLKVQAPPTVKKPKPDAASETGVNPELVRMIESKRPIFLAGAGGASWETIPPSDKMKVVEGIRHLLTRLDPDKVYFLKGRTKTAGGVNMELENAIATYNASHTRKFESLTMLVESEKILASTEPHNHTLKLNLPLMSMAEVATDFLKKYDGAAFYIGGKKNTRDFILDSAEKNIPFGLMGNIPGASREKASVYKGHIYMGARSMAEWARQTGLTTPLSKPPFSERAREQSAGDSKRRL